MARAKRICPKPGCPHVAVGRYCPQHNREYEAKRGSYYQRSGGAEFAAKRKAAAQQVEAGGVNCWRCGHPIMPGEPFDLGHDDNNRSIIRGPEHPRCNRSAAGRKGRSLQT